jgi:hypothetical protein
VIGLIAETCEESFKENLQEQMMTLAIGVQSANIRVKYAALQALAELMEVLAPKVQIKFHSQLTPKLIEMMKEDTFLKMKTQATTTMLNFCQGLQNSEEDEENDVNGADILNQYVTETLQVLGPNLNEGIQKKH